MLWVCMSHGVVMPIEVQVRLHINMSCPDYCLSSNELQLGACQTDAPELQSQHSTDSKKTSQCLAYLITIPESNKPHLELLHQVSHLYKQQ